MPDRRLILDLPVRRVLLRKGITTAEAEKILDLLDGAEELPEPGGYRPARPETEISRGVAVRPSLTVAPAELVQPSQVSDAPAAAAAAAEVEEEELPEIPGEVPPPAIFEGPADGGGRSRALPSVGDLVSPPPATETGG